MNILYLGRPGCPLGARIEALCADGHRFSREMPAASPDVVIDTLPSSPVDLRGRVAMLAGTGCHYVRLSSHQVYPPAPRLRPWQAGEVDPFSEQFPSLPAETAHARALEREAALAARRAGIPLTLLRPALVEYPGASDSVTRWFARRVAHGGVVVFPEGNLPTYRCLTLDELARALLAVAGREAAFGETLNAANHAILGYWGHAALVRDALGMPLRFGYVPQWRWRAAGLTLPLGEAGSTAFIEPSPLLAELGWSCDDPVAGMHAVVRETRSLGLGEMDATIRLERRVLEEHEQASLYKPGHATTPLPQHRTRQWVLRGWAGRPAGLALERLPEANPMWRPLVKVRALTLGPSEEKLLKGEYPQTGHRAIGHNALLEILQPGESGLAAGSLAVPVAALACGNPECRFCRGGAHGVVGIGCDGYGWGICPTPEGHLVSVPGALGHAALLADPLAALIHAMQAPLALDDQPVWIAGRTIEALLASWLAEDAGRPVVRVDRRDWPHPAYPVGAVERLRGEVQAHTRTAPTLALDFTGSADVSWPLGLALKSGGTLLVRNRPPGVAQGIVWHNLPAAAPNRAALEQAMERLANWHQFRDLQALVGPAIPLDLFWDVFLPAPFSMPYLEDVS
jgi:hypothetical protein